MADIKDAFVILSPGFAASLEDSTCLPMQQQFVKTISSQYPQLKIIVLSFQYPYHQKEYEWNGITIIPFDGRNKGGVQRLFLRKKVNAVLRSLLGKYQVKGLLSFWLGECALVGKRFAERYGLRHYCWISGQDARVNNKYVMRIRPKENELIALSDFLQKEFEKNYGIKPFLVIPPGIESPGTMHAERSIDILGVGSLILLKQYEIFIEVLGEIKKQHPTVKAVLAGDGPEKDRLVNMVSRIGLEDNARFTGTISHDEVLDLMHQSKILLHPSSYEGFSGVCMEALSRGAHVVSFCRAMDKDINHWHIVHNKVEMKEKTLELLNQSLDHDPVIISGMKLTVERMMQLYPLSTSQKV